MAAKTLRQMIINRVALVDVGSNPGAEIMLFKSKKKEDPPQPEDKEFTDMKIDATKYSKEEKEQLTALLAKGGVTVEPDEKPVPEEVLKTLAPEVRAMVEKAQATADQAVADAKLAKEQANEATATAQLEKAAREETEFVGQNTAIVKAFAGEGNANAKVLFRIKKAVKAEDYAELEKMLKAGGEAMAKLTNQEIGHSEEGRTHGEAYAELKSKAEELVKAKPGTKFSKAFEDVCNAHPDLVAEYRNEKKTGTRAN